MNVSLNSRRRPAQITIVSALVLLTLAFWFPGRMLVHGGVVVLVCLIIMFGRHVSNMATAWLALATTLMFIVAGLVSYKDNLLGSRLFVVSVLCSIVLLVFYVFLYVKQQRRK